MSAAHRRYLLLEHGAGSAVFNFFLNALIAWLMFRGLQAVPLWGQQSIAGDTIGTTLLLPLLTCLIATRIARGHVRRGRVATLGWSRDSHPLLRLLPAGTFARGVTLAAATTALAAPVTLWALAGAGVASLGLWSFVAFKATFAAGLAAVVQPLVAVWAIAEGR
jgi:hypothetical protein